jgi:light-regulated signal transduction histidine kinase (bacteriophytochrome)
MEQIISAACDREPIHIPGAIQPHGVLLVLEPDSERIVQAALDEGKFPVRCNLLGSEAGVLLGTSLGALIQSAGLKLTGEPVYLGPSTPLFAAGEMDVIAHRRDGFVVLELEPAPGPRASAPHLLGAVRAIAAAMESAPGVQRLCESASRELRRLTGFDRVMIYRFLDDGAGYVLAEDRAPEMPSFVNHHYPASDIPKPARELYLRNLIRAIPDVGYAPVPLTPSICPSTGQPLDMSDCALRSVSPIHVQYLKNMGVSASMSVSIVREGRLWGLVACHHARAKPVPYEIREACKHVGQILSQQIGAREAAERVAQARSLTEAREEILSLFTRAHGPVETSLLQHAFDLQSLVSSDGVAVICGNEIAAIGHRPDDSEIRHLAHWLQRPGSPNLFATDRLPEQHAPAMAYCAEASGLLAITMSADVPAAILWFRAEWARLIEWAGNPDKAVDAEASPGKLSPRASFQLWQETVRGRSRPWGSAELETAQRFRNEVIELRRQQRLQQLNQRLREALAEKEVLIAQKDLLVREGHHRIQNSLQLVTSMLSLQEHEAGDPHLADRLAEARRRIMAVSAVHRRLWRSDQIQNVRFDAYIRELRDGLIEEFGERWDKHIRIYTVPILVPTDRALVLALVLTELLTNAVKHAYGGGEGPIEVIIAVEASGGLRIAVADQGLGHDRRQRPGGFGLRLTQALVAQLRGRMETHAAHPGTKVMLTVPLPPEPAGSQG